MVKVSAEELPPPWREYESLDISKFSHRFKNRMISCRPDSVTRSEIIGTSGF